MGNLNANEYQTFESIKHSEPDGGEYWFARELAPVLEYKEWRNFNKVLARAMLACNNSGYTGSDHFVEVNKIVEAGISSKPIIDYRLTRYACYLIVQNGDPRKEVIALGQTYFAIQTRRQDAANEVHFLVGKEVRKAIERVGGTMPENLPTPSKSITEIEKEQLRKLKKLKQKLMLDE